MATRTLTIEIDDGSLPRGRVHQGGGADLLFTGWVELAAAIDRARGAGARRDEPAADGDAGARLRPPAPRV